MPQIQPLRVAVSARSLFDMDESHEIFERQGLKAYTEHLHFHEEEPLGPGSVFPLMKALLRLNELSPADQPIVDPVIVSSIQPVSSLRIINSLAHHALPIKRACFTGGAPTVPILKAFETDLFLSRSEADVQQAIDAGIAAAVMFSAPDIGSLSDDFQFRVAIDGDAVIFTDESEKIYKAGGKENGLRDFLAHEELKAREPLADGPFAKLLRSISALQTVTIDGRRPFRIILVTARGGAARERVIRTLAAWRIEIDESYFLSGFRKDRILEAVRPAIFFDDQWAHVGPASLVVPSGLVPWKREDDLVVSEGEAA